MANAKTDAVLNRDPAAGEFEWDLQIGDDGDILTEDFFDTAIWVSLFTDARASASEVAVPQQRRGWIGDLETPEDPWGSKLWLLYQRRLTTDVLSLATDWAKLALEWMVRDNIALGVEATAQVTHEDGLILNIVIRRPNGESESRSVALWDRTGK